MKKYLVSLLAGVSMAASAAVYSEQPFVNGWNLYATNGASAVINNTNLLFTYIHGEIFFSLTNNMGQTNVIAPNAFDDFETVYSDVNADVNANAAIHYMFNYTNLIPIAITNSAGQYFVSNSWPLLNSVWPTYMYPATTNVYPTLPSAAATNAVTFNFQRGWRFFNGEKPYYIWDSSTNVFSFTVAGTGPQAGITNLPTSFLQGAELVRMHSVYNFGTNAAIINQVSIGQWRP